MIGQVTPIGMANSGWKFYILFVVSSRPSYHSLASQGVSTHTLEGFRQ